MKSRIVRKPDGTLVRAFYNAKTMCFCGHCKNVVLKKAVRPVAVFGPGGTYKETILVGPCCAIKVALLNETADPIDPVTAKDVCTEYLIKREMTAHAKFLDQRKAA